MNGFPYKCEILERQSSDLLWMSQVNIYRSDGSLFYRRPSHVNGSFSAKCPLRGCRIKACFLASDVLKAAERTLSGSSLCLSG
jgi:hypothetical protein